MDTSETYIKMRVAARGYLPDYVESADLLNFPIVYWVTPNVFINAKGNYYYSNIPQNSPPCSFAAFTCQLERQDQLQATSGLDWRSFDKKCLTYEHPIHVPTKEQAGIRVVMKEKYSKVWDGEDWVETKDKEAKMAEVKKKRKGQYFMACSSCKQSTFNLTKEEANRTTCPRCGSTRIIIDRG